jgi:predicted dehydrogenase
MPTWLHHRIVLAAIAARKHVIVDKPMAATGAEALEIFEAGRATKRVNADRFNNRNFA